jgi:hypothetical protein
MSQELDVLSRAPAPVAELATLEPGDSCLAATCVTDNCRFVASVGHIERQHGQPGQVPHSN